ncbi:major surface protease gp63, putative [Trypanosoma brucei gambiense DAL972]|uniref:Leishmanolysin-like peptidase n=1 Tax=Trypanosoma brucei gambiense (strain MHOM/CI/86/DAL972) TaxID=679716 RepID=D0A855_TRYB9|nr:major surface protease gp63, putative [Trypanosoma brucei gambiense DAL972]CBH17856.1 major surface protease gp63, putative [Trypanosoma brucei gambiense DAL972]|eukprot:XP_011780120.1 major surface protease gp63, putative [Trypanosoma brucei gambiense DAL972]
MTTFPPVVYCTADATVSLSPAVCLLAAGCRRPCCSWRIVLKVNFSQTPIAQCFSYNLLSFALCLRLCVAMRLRTQVVGIGQLRTSFTSRICMGRRSNSVFFHLWLSFASLCLGNSDSSEGSPPVSNGTSPVVLSDQSVANMEANDSQWKPIRIVVSAKDLDDSLKYCVVAGVPRPDFMGGTLRCKTGDVLTNEKRLILTEHALPSAIHLHAERLLVGMEIDNIVVPEFDSPACKSFTVPIHHRSVGVPQADIILYVASGPAPHDGPAYATTCASLLSGRPIAGAINFSPSAITESYLYIRTVAHEIAHVLGFNFEAMKQLNMVGTKNIRGKSSVKVVKTPNVVKVARQYYGCGKITGMELEDNGDDSVRNSHWKRRIARDDLMTAIMGVSHYSELTLAFFLDTGFYRVNWEKGERMRWGHGAGCSFIEGKCMENNETNFPDMFCNDSAETLSCTHDRQALGRCTVHSYAVPIEESVRYFTMSWVGGSDNNLMDYCPVVEPYTDSYCRDGRRELLPGSRIGESSRCVKGEGLVAFTTHVGDICVEIHCGKRRGVSIRYSGDDSWHVCPEGGHVTPDKTFSEGRIVCPKWEEVCDDNAMTLSCLAAVFAIFVSALSLVV